MLGPLPRTLPTLARPELDTQRMAQLFVPAVLIGLLGFLELISVAKKFAGAGPANMVKKKTLGTYLAIIVKGHYAIIANQELTAMGFANLLGSFFSSFPVGGADEIAPSSSIQ